MDPARWHVVNQLFHGAIGRSAEARRTWLEHECDGDRALIEEVDRLIRAHEHAHDFLLTPRLSVTASELTDSPIGLDFHGTHRFAVQRLLGVGGMGVVYEVHDRERNENVALKTLLRVTPAEILRLKQEFRRLADVAHPNLVSLYELFVEDERCFFTMELVKGVTFVEYVRGDDEFGAACARRVVPQLVGAISGLHRQGLLHRDIKSSNVLVTADGRVVVLDFGLIAEIAARSPDEQMAGTPAYMSPERLLGAAASEASDWYAVGVMLYEALSGRLPFLDPPAPATFSPEVPDDLNEVCMGLLHRDPALRFSGAAALARLERRSADLSSSASLGISRESPFVGRRAQLDVLSDALNRTRVGQLSLVFVNGPSGIGKTALVRRFFDRLAEQTDVVLLAGRCYENESVPYKALDGMVDSLSRYLTSLSREAAARLLPPDASALGRLFPVLKRVRGVMRASALDGEISDPLMFRRRAFAALRELLARIAAERPLLIFVDDFHWADADSAQLFADLLRPPDSPAALVIVCCRSEEITAKPFLGALLEQAGSEAAIPLSIGPMSDDEANQLVASLVPAESGMTADEQHRIAREAGGSPFFLDQLARHAAAHATSEGRGPTLTEMIERRLYDLTPGARAFLRALAICGRPMARSVVHEACGLTGDELSLVARLRTAHFVRSSGSAERVEMYHDRIREALLAELGPTAVREIHGALARTLVSRGVEDPDALVEHYSGAGDGRSAASYAVRAAEKASSVLDFDRAAMLYRRALELAPDTAERAVWNEQLALALVHGGRPAEAGEVFLAAAADAAPAERVELQRRAAEQFLIGGHIDQGLDLIRRVLAAVRVSPSRNPRGALTSLAWQRARLRWRGLQFVPRRVEEVDRDTLLRLDTCWSAASGLMLVDMMTGADYGTRHLLMALDAGEPSRIARGLAFESCARGAFPMGRKLAERLVDQSKALARRVGHPQSIGMSLVADGLLALTIGQWRRALGAADEAVPILRDQVVGFTWELNIAHNIGIWALMYLGELREVVRRVPPLLATARSRGNLFLATELCTRSNYAWLARDNPDEGEREAIDGIARWSQKGFHRQHYGALLARVQTALYRGDGDGAWRLFSQQQRLLQRSYVTRVQLIRIESNYLQARAALAMSACAPNADRYVSIARRCARTIERARMPWSNPLALLLQGCIAARESQPAAALSYLHDALVQFERAEMKLYAAITRFRISALQDDASGLALRREGERWMAEQEIKNPAAMTRMLAPGFLS